MSLQLAREGNARRARFYAPRPEPAPARPITRPFQGAAERAAPGCAAQVAAMLPMPAPEPPAAPPARDWLLVARPVSRPVSRTAEIQQAVAAHYGFTPTDLRSYRRSKDVALARHVAVWITKRQTLRSSSQIGSSFGGRDHTTVLYAVRRIDRLRTEDADLVATIDAIIASLKLEAE